MNEYYPAMPRFNNAGAPTPQSPQAQFENLPIWANHPRLDAWRSSHPNFGNKFNQGGFKGRFNGGWIPPPNDGRQPALDEAYPGMTAPRQPPSAPMPQFPGFGGGQGYPGVGQGPTYPGVGTAPVPPRFTPPGNGAIPGPPRNVNMPQFSRGNGMGNLESGRGIMNGGYNNVLV